MTRAAARVPLWRRHDVRIAWSAGLVNDTGDWVLTVGLPVFVFVETRSGAATAVLFVCQLLVAALFGPLGGALVDRVDLRRCLVATNVAQAVTLVPLLAVNEQRVWPAYLVVVAQAALTQVNNPANVALLPRLVADDELAAANAALAASSSLARLVGSPLGGLLVAWGGLAPVMVVDAASFLIVAASLSFLRSDTSPLPEPEGHHAGHRRSGLRIVRSTPPLAMLLSLQGLAQLAQGGFVVLFVAFVVDTLGDDGRALGVIRGTMAVGALIGAAVIGRIGHRVDPATLYGTGLIGMGAVSLAFWNAPEITTAVWVYVVLFALSGVPGSALTVGLFTTLQTHSPRHAIGRVTGLLGTAEAVGTAAGAIVAGLLVDRFTLRPLLDAQAGIYLAAGTLAMALIARRERARRPRPAEGRRGIRWRAPAG